MVIAFVNTKGGVGKSTLAGNLAIYLHDQGKLVAFVDADHHVSSSLWMREVEPKLPIWASADPNAILDRVPSLASEFDTVVIDGPGSLDEVTRTIALVSDQLVVPCVPGMFDARATQTFVTVLNRLRDIRGGRPNLLLVKNKVQTNTHLTGDLREAATTMGVPIAKAEIHLRQVHSDVVTQGTVASRFVKTNKTQAARAAAEELAQLFGEVCDESPINS
jgi:chromosome partitioning protein